MSTFILSQIFINKGTCITNQVFRVAGFFHQVAVSHFSPGGVSSTVKTTLGSRFMLIGIQLNSCRDTLSQSTKNNSAPSRTFLLRDTCSYVSIFIK